MGKKEPTNMANAARCATTPLEKLQASPHEIRLSNVKSGPNKLLKTAFASFQGKPLYLKLSDTFLRIPFAPSMYNGTGDEERKTIVIEIRPEIEEVFAQLEDIMRQSLEEQQANIDSMWMSPIKPASGSYNASIKAKINVSGAKQAKFYNEENLAVEPPTDWRNTEAQVVVHVRGAYLQKNAAGLMLDVTHMRTRQMDAETPFASPF